MLETLKEAVCAANLELVKRGCRDLYMGNVSGIDREKGLMVIKPSGVPYESMTAGDMVAVDVETGETVGREMETVFRYGDPPGAVPRVSLKSAV